MSYDIGNAKNINLRLVQSNFRYDSRVDNFTRRGRLLSLGLHNSADIDLIIFPESAFYIVIKRIPWNLILILYYQKTHIF